MKTIRYLILATLLFALPAWAAHYTVTTTGNAIVVTDTSGNSDTLTVSEPSAGNIKFAAAGRTFSVDGGADIAGDSGDLSLTNVASITMNAGLGADIINVGAFTGTLPSLTLNGGQGDDTVNFNGDITFAANANLDADLINDDATPGMDIANVAASANLITSGTGAITVKVRNNIAMAAGSSFETVNGGITLNANVPGFGVFAVAGIVLDGATVLTSGTGAVSVIAQGAANCHGILVQGGAKVESTGLATITMNGTGAGSRHGVYVTGSGSKVSSATGNISVTGLAGFAKQVYGVFVQNGGVIEGTGMASLSMSGRNPLQTGNATASGNLTITGISGNTGGSRGFYILSAGRVASTSGNITINAQGLPTNNGNFPKLVYNTTQAMTTTGTITLSTSTGSDASMDISAGTISGDAGVILKAGAGTLINLGATSDFITNTLSLTDAELDRISTLGTLTIGDATSGAITISAPITRSAATVMSLNSAGSIALATGSIDSAGGNVTLTPGTNVSAANSGVDVTTSAASTLKVASGKALNIVVNGTTADTGYSQLNVAGLVDLTGVNLSVSGSYVPTGGDSFTIVENDGADAITGTFTGLAEGASIANFLGSGKSATVTYVGGTGNDVVVFLPFTLTYTAGANGTITGATSQTVNPGGSGTQVTAVADPGYTFVSWSDGVLTAARTDSSVTGNLNVTATFAAYGVLSFASATPSANPVNSLGQPNLVAVQINRTSGSDGAVDVLVTPSQPATVPTGFAKYVYGTDYEFVSGTIAGTTVSFADGQSSATVQVQLKTPAVTKKGQFKLTMGAPTGGATSGTPTVALVTINAKDATKPTVVITTPAATVATPGTFNLTGTVKDNGTGDLSLFTVTLNGATVTATRGAYVANTAVAYSANGLQAENGTNTLVVTARDDSGNTTVITKTFTCAGGSLSPALAGTYTGLLVASGTPDNDTTGFFTATITSNATFTGTVTLGGIAVPIKGLLNNAGVAKFTANAYATNLDLIDKVEFDSYLGSLGFTIPLAGGDVTATLSTQAVGGSTIATATARRNAFSATALVATANSNLLTVLTLTPKGVYNVSLPNETQPVLTSSQFPQGDGVGILTLSNTGVVTLKGNLADGTAYSATGNLKSDLTAPLHVNLYKKQGALAGTFQFDPLATDSDVSGANFLWLRPALPRARVYKAGWANGVTVDPVGTKHIAPTAGSVLPSLLAVNPTGNATLDFTDGLLSPAVSKSLNIAQTTANTVTKLGGDTSYALTVVNSTGGFSGTFTHSPGKSVAYKGIILNKGGNKGGFGYFLSPPPLSTVGGAEGGSVTLTAKP